MSFPSVLQESRPLGATLISDCVTLTGCEDEDQDSGVAKVKMLDRKVDSNTGPPRQGMQARFGPCLDFGFQYALIKFIYGHKILRNLHLMYFFLHMEVSIATSMVYSTYRQK